MTNTLLGTDAGVAITTGVQDTFLGFKAGEDTTTGSRNTAVGAYALMDNTDGLRNVAVGRSAGEKMTSADDNVVIGHGASLARTTGDRNVIIGANANNTQTTGGDDNSIVGQGAAPAATGFGNALLGMCAASALTTGYRNVGIGSYSLQGLTDGYYNVAIGYGTSVPNGSTGAIAIGANVTAYPYQVVIGDAQTEDVQFYGRSMMRVGKGAFTYYFGGAGNKDSTGQACIGIGADALLNHTSGGHLIAVGKSALEQAADAGSIIAIGGSAGQVMGTTGPARDCVFIGYGVGSKITEGIGATAVGHLALEFATVAGNNTGFGDSALRYTTTGSANTAMGYVVMDRNTTGSQNVAIGQGCATYRGTGDRNVHIGVQANQLTDPGGTGGQAGGSDNVGIGHQSLLSHTGAGVVAVGSEAGRTLTTAADGVYIGRAAGNDPSQKIDAVNQIVIGADAFGTRDNEVVLGGASVEWTIIRGVLQSAALTVSALPSAATAGAGARAFVTDATAATFADVVAGGGAIGVPVYSDGTDWRVG